MRTHFIAVVLVLMGVLGLGAVHAAEATVPVGDIKAGKPVVRQGALQPAFADGTPVQRTRILRSGGNFVLERAGKKPNGRCQTSRVKLQVIGNTLVVPRGPVLAVESCSGQNCQLCEFKSTGGCACREPVSGSGASVCNHTISEEDEFSNWITQASTP